MLIYGLLTAQTILATKLDLCATCNVAGPHAIIRRTRWIEIFFLPIAPVWVNHRLVCANCGAETKLGFGQVRQALREGKLPLPPRANFQAYADALYDANERRPYEREFDPIERNPKRDAWNVLLKAWPVIVVLAIAGIAFLPKAFAGPPEPSLQSAGHECWAAADGSINGCKLHDGSIMGEQSGTPITCYFTEPLPSRGVNLTCID